MSLVRSSSPSCSRNSASTLQILVQVLNWLDEDFEEIGVCRCVSSPPGDGGVFSSEANVDGPVAQFIGIGAGTPETKQPQNAEPAFNHEPWIPRRKNSLYKLHIQENHSREMLGPEIRRGLESLLQKPP